MLRWRGVLRILSLQACEHHAKVLVGRRTYVNSLKGGGPPYFRDLGSDLPARVLAAGNRIWLGLLTGPAGVTSQSGSLWRHLSCNHNRKKQTGGTVLPFPELVV